MKGLDKEIKELIELKANMDEVIAEFTDYITDNYDRLRREIIIETYDKFHEIRKETIK